MATIGAEEQALEQQKLNQLATAQQTAYQLPMTRLTDVANIYGSVSGAMPGSPTQPFTQSPVATGIGSFFGMQNLMKGVNPGAKA
jgi:hypothetical protein